MGFISVCEYAFKLASPVLLGVYTPLEVDVDPSPPFEDPKPLALLGVVALKVPGPEFEVLGVREVLIPIPTSALYAPSPTEPKSIVPSGLKLNPENSSPLRNAPPLDPPSVWMLGLVGSELRLILGVPDESVLKAMLGLPRSVCPGESSARFGES